MKRKNNKTSKILLTVILALIVIASITTYALTYSEYTTTTTLSEVENNSGVFDNMVIVDETESDYNYYESLNYTASSTGSLPSGENQNIYNEKNLVNVEITYDGTDINDNTLVGYVSLTERQNTYKYYKVYPINDGYIDITLIENPFTDRPIDKGFNGWVTDYKGVTIQYNDNYYERHAKIPVTDTSNIKITFHANWVTADVGKITSTSNQWSSTFNKLKDKGMVKIGGKVAVYEDITGLYTQKTVTSSGSWWSKTYYPDNAYDRYGNDISGDECRNRNGCTYYSKVTENNYDSSVTYYKLSTGGWNNQMQVYTPQITGYENLPGLDDGIIVSGYYKKVTIDRYSSISGYYSDTGEYQESGTCNNYNGCEYYELMQYYDNDGNVIVSSSDNEYYYLATRDTNIIVMQSNTSSVPSRSQNKPYTLTSIYNGTSYRDNVTWDVSSNAYHAYSDVNIENIKINSNTGNNSSSPSSGTSNSKYFYGNYHNVRIGRGIVQSGSYKTFNAIIAGDNDNSGNYWGGGSSTGSVSNPTKYKVIIESGFYNSISLANASYSNSSSRYLNSKAIYGNDYDKVTKNNNNLDINFCASSSWGGGNYYATNTTTSLIFDFVVKSGKFGSGKSDYATGIYVGGRGYGDHYAPKKVKVEGGWIYNLIGGPTSSDNRDSLNDIYMYITGGEVDTIVGGAGLSTTYGNRIIAVTGGVVNYQIFGGSNGYIGSDGDGKLSGSSFIYIGGNAIIGKEDNVNNGTKLWNAEAGSVFGIGNGKSGTDSIGTNDNSTIIVDSNATILGNVYGGGNYGATGINSSSNSNYSNISLLGGTIKGNVYGGGNNNGASTSSKEFKVNITLNGGLVEGSIYGGSRTKGTVYGDVALNLLSGTVRTSCYGGGEGGYQSSSSPGTFVTGEVKIITGIENEGNENLKIENAIYGGSAFGTVNGASNSTTISSKNTNIEVLSGTINSVFGGGEGNGTYTPYVLGNVAVDIKGGIIDNVYGGSDQRGTPNGSVTVNVHGGKITNAYAGGNQTEVSEPNINFYGGTTTNGYGGGNQAKVDISHVLLNGGTVTNLFGASNTSGDVTTSNVNVKSGKVTNVYGGNNIGGTTNTSNVSIDGGDVTNVYGGGRETDIVSTTNVNLNNRATNVFGGSDQKGTVHTSYININDGIADSVYGGNNLGGTTVNSNVTVTGGIITSIYGGGLEAETTTSNLNIIHGKIDYLFGGGKSAGVITTHLNLNKGYIKNIFGGSNVLGNVTTTNIKNTPQELESNSNLYADVSFDTSTVNQTNPSGIKSSEKINVTLHNDSTTSYTNWDFYLITTDAVFDSNWSGTNVEEINGVFHSNQTNQWYGANALSANSTHSFEFYIHSYVDYSDFQIVGYILVGHNSDGTDTKTIYYNDLYVNNMYGGNNEGGLTKTSNINLTSGSYGSIYGGGNKAVTNKPNITTTNATILKAIYGGGNEASILKDTSLNILDKTTVKGDIYGGGNAALVDGDTSVLIKNATISGNTYGGGNDGAVLGNAITKITDSTIGESVHAGGNGKTAVVVTGNEVDVSGKTVITKHLFGGGNAAATGCENDFTSSGDAITCTNKNSAKSYVNIAGATILGNVYGGANTSVVYGETYVNIGINTIEDATDYQKDDIIIGGTVFGGGEANASGSVDYDFKFISVTKGININIDASKHTNYIISGSILGSGNASSSGGYSYVNINNYGNGDNYKTNVSIQRADVVTLNNSAIELLGATDRTNKYKNELFTFSRIKHLKLKNGSVLYLNKGTNLLEKYSSLVDINGKEKNVEVTIDKENQKVAKNGENRIYMLEGKNLNISDDESLATYGEVSGMTFFGMFTKDRNGKITTALYSDKYNYGDTISGSEIYHFSTGSYVMGQHKENHNYYKDGFYTNYPEENGTTIKQDYIEPTPNDTIYYRWVVGESVEVIDLSLTASKYSTLGTYELQLLNYYQPNTEFHVLGVNYDNLSSNIELLSSEDIPRYANTTEEANKNFGLSIKTGTNGWITKGDTEFITQKGSEVKGTTTYKSENSSTIPSFIFYLYHSKNLNVSADLGSVTISLMVSTPIDDLNSKIQRVNIQVNLSSALYDGDNYEGAITVGEQYEMFANSNVHITSTSTFSTYFSLFKKSNFTPYKDGYYRSLVSNYALPKNTKITMIDFASSDKPEYYYYVISKEDYENSLNELYTEGEISYPFSRFIKMGSSSANNTYSDSDANNRYYDSTNKKAEEEFIFNVDLKEANIDATVLKKNLLMELRDKNDNPVIPVLDIAQQKMTYNLYKGKDAIIDAEATLSNDTIYVGSSVELNVITNFDQQKTGSINIIDTNFYNQKLGIRLSLYDSEDNLVNGATLLGTKFIYEGVNYFPRQDGTVRFNIAESVANVSSKITIDTTNSNIPSGEYHLKIETFGSADGIYYGLAPSTTISKEVTIINENFGLSVSMDDADNYVDAKTGRTSNKSKMLDFNLEYESNLKKPSIRVALYRRTYTDIYKYSYTKVNLQDYVTDTLKTSNTTNEYLVMDSPSSRFQYILNLKDKLKTGTYQIKFLLYDNNTYVGEVVKYIIIK